MSPLATWCDGVTDTLALAKTLHPGQRNNLDALCKRYGVDNTARTLHGALLDCELLAAVYLALTRGQESLSIGLEMRSEQAARDAAHARPRPILLAASEAELEAHASLLEAIARKARALPVGARSRGRLEVRVPRRRGALCRIARLGLALACLLLAPAPALAARVAVVLSDDSAPYQEVYQVIRAYLDGTRHEVSRLDADGLTAPSLNEARLTVAVGVRAAEVVAMLPTRPPVLAVLVPRAWYLKTGHTRLSDGGRRSASAIYLDQPFERQAQLIRLAFPEARRVGVLSSREQGGLLAELDVALRLQQLSLVHATLAEDERLIPQLENVLSEADFMLAFPDPQVFNRNTAQSILHTSYRTTTGAGLFALADAGGALCRALQPGQIGRQTAEGRAVPCRAAWRVCRCQPSCLFQQFDQ